MERKMKLFLMSFILTIFMFFMVSTSFSQPVGPIGPIRLLPDLVIESIKGRCPDCVCGSTNFQNHPLVEYQEDIRVNIINQGKVASGPCKLKIEFYDVVGGRPVVINKSVPEIQPGGGHVVTEIGQFLYKKSTGIKATIDSTNVVKESDETNNSKTVNECIKETMI